MSLVRFRLWALCLALIIDVSMFGAFVLFRKEIRMQGLVITGPTGTIGMAMIKKCIEEKINVMAICHPGSKRIQQIPKSKYVKVVEADLTEYEEMNIVKDNDVVYDVFLHLAWNGTFGDARNNIKNQVENVKYTIDAVELSKRIGCKVFIGAGSQAEYGRVDAPLTPMTPAFPENGYGIAKLSAGYMSRLRCEQLGIKHIWTRILSVYGPYDGENTMVISTLTKMLNNEETHFTAGDQIWDYLYCDDAARMLFYLADKGEDKKTYCLGSADRRPLKEYITKMYEITGCKARLGLGDVPYGDRQVMCLCLDKQYLVGCGTQVPFEEGIAKTIEYIKDRKRV